jgi:hypothetical protein
MNVWNRGTLYCFREECQIEGSLKKKIKLMALRNTRRNKWNLGMGEELHSSTTLRNGRSNDKLVRGC